MPPPPALILASASPRRRELLTAMGVFFEIRPANIDEAAIGGDHPRTVALRIAYAKARAVADLSPEGAIVLAADTVVALGPLIIGKPASEVDVRWALSRLSGRAHSVITAVALARAGSSTVRLESENTKVVFRELTAAEIEDYAASTEPRDKAGSYAIQGAAAAFVERIEGDYFNVVGFPCALVLRMLRDEMPDAGWKLPQVPERWRQPPRR